MSTLHPRGERGHPEGEYANGLASGWEINAFYHNLGRWVSASVADEATARWRDGHH